MTYFTAFPSGLSAALQTGFLNREFEEGLDSALAYRRIATQETVPTRIGETLTRTRKGRNIPTITPLSGANVNANLDNSLTVQSYLVEQYTLIMQLYGQTIDVNLIQQEAGIADQAIAAARNNGVAAAQSLERLAKIQLYASYCGGNTFVRSNLGTNTTTTVYVDDIRGFQYVSNNGALVPVSPTYPLACNEFATSQSGVTQTFDVVGAVASGTSQFPGSAGTGSTDGISGYLTITNAGSAPVAGDAIIASNAPYIVRPNGRYSTNEIIASDVLTWGTIMDAVAYLRNAGVPPLPNGTYGCIMDNTSIRQMMSDQQFMIAYAGAHSDPVYTGGDVFQILGVTFIPTTEAYVQYPSADIKTTIRRPIVVGGEALIQGNFEGLEFWLNRSGMEEAQVSNVMLVNGVAHILRAPLDRLQQTVSLSWAWVGGFTTPSDLTANNSIIPTIGNNLTGGNPLYKRCVVIETAG